MDQSSAYGAGHTVGTIFGYIFIYGGILALGVYVGRRLSRGREDGRAVNWPVGVSVAVVILAIIGQCSPTSQAQPPAVSASSATASDVEVVQQIMPKAANMPTEFGSEFVKLYNNGVRAGLVDSLHKRDATIAVDQLRVSTNVAEVSGRKILRSRAEIPSRLFLYQFAGHAKGTVVIVVCSSRTATPFETSGTHCGQAVAKVFGEL